MSAYDGYRIEGEGNQTGGIEVDPDMGRVIVAPPSLKFMRGWTLAQVEAYVKRRGWKIEKLPPGAIE